MARKRRQGTALQAASPAPSASVPLAHDRTQAFPPGWVALSPPGEVVTPPHWPSIIGPVANLPATVRPGPGVPFAPAMGYDGPTRTYSHRLHSLCARQGTNVTLPPGVAEAIGTQALGLLHYHDTLRDQLNTYFEEQLKFERAAYQFQIAANRNFTQLQQNVEVAVAYQRTQCKVYLDEERKRRPRDVASAIRELLPPLLEQQLPSLLRKILLDDGSAPTIAGRAQPLGPAGHGSSSGAYSSRPRGRSPQPPPPAEPEDVDSEAPLAVHEDAFQTRDSQRTSIMEYCRSLPHDPIYTAAFERLMRAEVARAQAAARANRVREAIRSRSVSVARSTESC